MPSLRQRVRVVWVLALLLGVVGAQARADEPGCRRLLPDLDPECTRPARFAGFAPPTTQPFYFEDPFINTGVSSWVLAHEFPSSSVFEGGDLRALAVQVRVALTERLALIATKDGHIEIRPDLDLMDDEKGYGDLGLGFKYALIHRPDDRFILTPSLRYELTQGSRDVLQGNGRGTWIPAVSMGLGIERAHLLANVGARLPVDRDAESSIVFYHAQLGFELTRRLRPFLGLNGLSYVDDGDGSTRVGTKLGRLPIDVAQHALGTGPFEALDAANLGSRGVDGKSFFSFAVGLRYQLRDGIDIGLAYERPLTKRRWIMKQRVTLNLLLDL